MSLFDNSLFNKGFTTESTGVNRDLGDPGLDPEIEKQMVELDGGEGAEEVGTEDATLESEQIMNEVMLYEGSQSIGLEGLTESTEELGSLLAEGAVTEATVVRLDKNARISQLQKAAAFTIAREKRDPHYKKLVTVWRMERMLEDKLMRKYGNEARRRAKKHVQKNYRQRGKAFVKIHQKSSSKLNPSPGSGKVKTRSSHVVKPTR